MDRGHPQYWAIKAVYDHAIIKGNKGQFRPSAVMTKLEALVGILRLSGLPMLSDQELRKVNLPFTDVSTYRWAQDYLKLALHHGLIKKSSSFRPRNKITRAQLLDMMYRTPHVQQEALRVFGQ